ncbi:hypothetical protein ER308_08140 [Egibacter rhizosphaerae]|uniref:Uncharacterized protein n=1 Tax=Egibacter rhizosphaerae TaxID=1670831 RepID=A0A411YEH4_9ACTN|nr:hypothetical protein ER308_08140 [Egibacter rhizosphaerae]
MPCARSTRARRRAYGGSTPPATRLRGRARPARPPATSDNGPARGGGAAPTGGCGTTPVAPTSGPPRTTRR